MTDRVREFLRTTRPEGPCLVVDLEEVRRNYLAFERALPDSRIFYAVKANPAPELLAGLPALGSSFDCASLPEIEAALAAGATPQDRKSTVQVSGVSDRIDPRGHRRVNNKQ